MRFSKMVDYKGEPHFLCRTGRRNVRILKPGEPYEKSFVVPIKKVSNKRPADIECDSEDEIEDDELRDEADELQDQDVQDEQFLPQ